MDTWSFSCRGCILCLLVPCNYKCGTPSLRARAPYISIISTIGAPFWPIWLKTKKPVKKCFGLTMSWPTCTLLEIQKQHLTVCEMLSWCTIVAWELQKCWTRGQNTSKKKDGLESLAYVKRAKPLECLSCSTGAVNTGIPRYAEVLGILNS